MKYARIIFPFLILAALIWRISSPPFDETLEEEAVLRVIKKQQDNWNKGDIDGFMTGYAPIDTLRFVSGGNVREGWQATRDAYHAGYPDRSAMGTLFFEDLKVNIVDAKTALVFGVWRLERDEDEPWGRYTLILEKNNAWGGWRVIYDHTSSAEVVEVSETELNN